MCRHYLTFLFYELRRSRKTLHAEKVNHEPITSHVIPHSSSETAPPGDDVPSEDLAVDAAGVHCDV